MKWAVGSLTAVGVLGACGKSAEMAYERWEDAQRKSALQEGRQFVASGHDYVPASVYAALAHDEEPAAASETASTDDSEREEMDDAALRRLVMEAEFGVRTPEQSQALVSLALSEKQKWSSASTEPGVQSPTQAGTAPWSLLGPAAARSEYNGSYYKAVDSGRVNKIRVDPRAANTVYIATSGGGVWYANDFGQNPTWQSITDGLGVLATGAIALDANGIAAGSPPRVWVGLGDMYDLKAGVVAMTPDNGATWPVQVALSGTHPLDNQPTAAQSVREIAVDPNDSSKILVAADDALYRSTNGGATFVPVDLPNAGTQVREAAWSIAYLGSAPDTNGVNQTQWLVSGVDACPGALPPSPGLGTASCSAGGGNYGEIWKSTDSGQTWVSLRGALPATITGSSATDVGVMVLATGANYANPASNVVYALAGTMNEAASATTAVFKSTDGGATWSVVGTQSSTVVNPTAYTTDCTTLNVGHDQSYYDLAIAVDPTNPDNVLIGGNLCGVRTRDGGATWENASHWLPQGGSGYTSRGTFLPYVHADWHAATIVFANGQVLALAGSDGGLFRSTDLFSAATGEDVHWDFPDYGLSTHLFYGHGSGDPVYGNGGIVFGGLQDNGTRFRLISDEYFIFDWNLQNWDQISGGDGIGAALAHDADGHNPVYWISVQGQYKYCRPQLQDCGKATRIENGIEIANYRRVTWSLIQGDAAPFLVRFSPINDARSSVVTASTYNVYKLGFTNPTLDLPVVTRLTPNNIVVAGATRAIRGTGVYASPNLVTVNGKSSRIYGLPLTSGRNGILIEPQDGSATTVVGNAALAMSNGVPVSYMSSVGFPKDPSVIGGTNPALTWVVSSVQTGITSTVFKTVDGGNTFTPFMGNGTGHDLPSVPVEIIRFDPNNDQIVYAGTELGLYRSTDAGQTWARYGVGLPYVRINEITLNKNSSLLRVSTYGRGVWEINPTNEVAQAPATGDWDGNGVIDFFDMAPTALRLGATAGTSSPALQPYDNLLDLTGASNAIGEDDLSALIVKFGGTP